MAQPKAFSLKLDDQIPLKGGETEAALFDADNLVKNLPFNLIDPYYRYSPMGGVPVMVRGGLIRIAFFKLAGTGVLAALVGLQQTDEKLAFSCLLSASVNFVAAGHYHGIWMVRSQVFPSGHEVFQAGRDREGVWRGREDGRENDQEKVFIAELYVDGWRHSDWTITREIKAARRLPV